MSALNICRASFLSATVFDKISPVATAASYPTDVKTLHFMLDEQRQLIESLKANLHRMLKWRFGPKSEAFNVDQFGLFADGSVVIEVPGSEARDTKETAGSPAPAAPR